MICSYCGGEFEGSPERTHCSLKCVHDSMKSPIRVCKGCGGPLSGRLRNQYCTKECELRSRRGDPEPSAVEGARWVPLTKGKFALVDIEDYERVKGHSWCAAQSKSGIWYARSWKKSHDGRTKLALHRFILNVEDPIVLIDHIDLDTLNCRKENLRIVTKSQNQMNTLQSGGATHFKGVAAVPNGKFRAVIVANHVLKYLGRFDTAEEAAHAYDEEARKMHGVHGRYNFPKINERSAR